MPAIVARNFCAKLIIVGDGSERRNLELLCSSIGMESHVNFVGQITQSRIAQYYCASDLFTLPSISEGFGTVLIEAMFAGLPIVATNVTGINEIVNNGENGYLVEPKNPTALSIKIIKLLDDERTRTRIGINNKLKARGRTWENYVSEILLLLKKNEQ